MSKARTTRRGKGKKHGRGPSKGGETRKGFVARLPRGGREKVNRMMDDGRFYDEIIKMVKKETGVVLKGKNLGKWKHGGHQDWLEERRRLEQMDKTREFALEVVKNSQGKVIAEAGLDVAAAQLYELLMNFDLQRLKKKLTERPEAYPKLVGILTK